MDIEEPKDAEKAIWEKLREIYVEFPQAQKPMGPENSKTYQLPVIALLNFALKYEKDEGRKELYRVFCNTILAKTDEEILVLQNKDFAKYEKLQQTYTYTPEQIMEIQNNCLEWQEYLEEQKKVVQETIHKLNANEMENNGIIKDIMTDFERLDERLADIYSLDNIGQKYPFLRHIDYKEKGEDDATRLTNHVAGTATNRISVAHFRDDIFQRFRGRINKGELVLYVHARDPKNIDKSISVGVIERLLGLLPDTYKDEEAIPARRLIADIGEKYNL